MPTLDLQLLGVPQLLIDNQPVHLVRRASLALLAYLAITKRQYPRDEIANFLGDDDSNEAARKRLRNVLTDLTEHGLGPFLLSDRRFIGMREPMAGSIDVEYLDALLSSEGPSDIDRMLWVVERCDLEFMAGVVVSNAPDFEAWQLNEREHRRRQLTTVTMRYLERHVWSGSHQEGIAIARRLVAVEPWNEDAHRALMRLLAADGQHAAALAQFERCRSILANDLGVEPQEETILAAKKLRSVQIPIRHNLPNTGDADELLGRDAPRDLLMRNLLDPRCQMLTVFGLGGIGKTSLSIAVASKIAAAPGMNTHHPFADGIVRIDPQIEPANGMSEDSEAEVAQYLEAIGIGLGIAFYGRVSLLEQVSAYLQNKNMLLVIDNADCIPGAPTLLRDLLERSPLITILAVSRAPLGLPNEWTLELPGLEVPATPEDVPSAAASQLVIRDALKIGVEICESDWPDLMALCRATGGLPLALKVAGNALSTLTCAEVACELAEGAMLLEDGTTVTGDSVSVKDAIHRSIALLPPAEQRSLPKLAVFTAPFQRDAAAAVHVSFSALAEYCRHSLVTRDINGNYALHPLVRRIVSPRLAEDPEHMREVCTQHAAHYAAIVDDIGPTINTSRNAAMVIDGMVWLNVQAAWDWATETRDLALLQRLFPGLDSWYLRSGEHARWGDSIRRALAIAPGTTAAPEWSEFVVRLHAGAAETLLWQGNLDAAFASIAQARAIAQQIDPIRLEALLSLVEGRLLRFRDSDGVAARESLHQARAIAHVTGATAIEAASLMALGHAAYDIDDFATAEYYAHRAATAYRAIGDRYALARTTMQQARLLVARGNFRTAETAVNETIRIAQTFSDRYVEASSRALLGTIFDVGYGRHRDAEEHFQAAACIGKHTGDPYLEGIILRGRGRNALHTGDFDEAAICFSRATVLARDHSNLRALDGTLVCLAYLSIATRDYAAGVDYAEQVVRSAQQMNRQFTRATGLLASGLAHECLGLPFEATAAYSQAISIAETLHLPHMHCEGLAGVAGVMSAKNDHDLARHAIQPAIDFLLRNQLCGCEEPSRVALTAYRILSGRHDPRAEEVARCGARIVQQRADLLPHDEGIRYIHAYPERVILNQMHPRTSA